MDSHRNALTPQCTRSAISLERMSPNYHGPEPQRVHTATNSHGHELKPSKQR